jgi:hypothetical protein
MFYVFFLIFSGFASEKVWIERPHKIYSLGGPRYSTKGSESMGANSGTGRETCAPHGWIWKAWVNVSRTSRNWFYSSAQCEKI